MGDPKIPKPGDPAPAPTDRDSDQTPSWVHADPFTSRQQAATPPAAQPEKVEAKQSDAEQVSPTFEKASEAPQVSDKEVAPPSRPEPAVASGEVAAKQSEGVPPSAPRSAADKVKVDPQLIAASRAPQGSATRGSVRSQPSRVPPRPPYSDDDGGATPPRRGRRLLRLPLWLWVLGTFVTVVITLLVFDLSHKDSYRLHCKEGKLTVQQAKRFPWPFGYDTLGGNLRPITAAPEADCTTQTFHSRESVEGAFIDFVVVQVRRAVANPTSPANLKQLRLQLHQARRLGLDPIHQGRSKTIKRLLADLSYREGRARLARVEMTLRESLALLQQAQKLGKDRYGDLEAWISHLEHLIKSVAPSPKPAGGALPFPLPALPTPVLPSAKGGKGSKGTLPFPSIPKPAPAPAPATGKTVDGGVKTPDGGAESSSGILM